MSERDAEPGDRLWESIRRSPLFGVYVSELYWLAANVVAIAEGVFDATVVGEDRGVDFMKVDPGLHSQLYAVLGEAAKIRALIQDRPRRRAQSRVVYAVQQRRIRALRDLLDGLDVEATLSADARHSLEHFDEKLDETAVRFAAGNAPLPMNLPFNIAVERRRALLVLRGSQPPLPKLFPLRVYIADERVFMNAGVEVNIGRIYEECRGIRDRLAAALPEEVRGERGASIVVLTEASFREPESD